MKPLLLLIDLQNDFLGASGLEPAAGQVAERATRLLLGCRERSVPVVHVYTTVRHVPDERMPHWVAANKWMCVQDTPGHEPPPALCVQPLERVVHKSFFSAFSSPDLLPLLQSMQVDTLLVAGVHLHGCVRATVMDAYAAGYEIQVADDAVASDDPQHAAMTRRYLEIRAARFLSVERLLANVDGPSVQPEAGLALPAAVVAWLPIASSGRDRIVHRSPHRTADVLHSLSLASREDITHATRAARNAVRDWSQADSTERAAMLLRLADRLAVPQEADRLAVCMARDIGKPVAEGRSCAWWPARP